MFKGNDLIFDLVGHVTNYFWLYNYAQNQPQRENETCGTRDKLFFKYGNKN